MDVCVHVCAARVPFVQKILEPWSFFLTGTEISFFFLLLPLIVRHPPRPPHASSKISLFGLSKPTIVHNIAFSP